MLTSVKTAHLRLLIHMKNVPKKLLNESFLLIVQPVL